VGDPFKKGVGEREEEPKPTRRVSRDAGLESGVGN